MLFGKLVNKGMSSLGFKLLGGVAGENLLGGIPERKFLELLLGEVINEGMSSLGFKCFGSWAGNNLFDGTTDLLEGKKLLELLDRKSTRLNSSHSQQSRMPSSA